MHASKKYLLAAAVNNCSAAEHKYGIGAHCNTLPVMSRRMPVQATAGCSWRSIAANKRPVLLVLATVCTVVFLSHALFVPSAENDTSKVSTRVAFTSHSLAGSDMPDLKPAFPMYQTPDTYLPAWVITSWNTSSVHRFFDSSPFSPSGRYVGVTRLHSEGTEITPKSTADIVVIDLEQGDTAVRKWMDHDRLIVFCGLTAMARQ